MIMQSNMTHFLCHLNPKQLCQVCVSSTVRFGIQILQIEDKTILLNNTKCTIYYRALLSEHLMSSTDQVMCICTLYFF